MKGNVKIILLLLLVCMGLMLYNCSIRDPLGPMRITGGGEEEDADWDDLLGYYVLHNWEINNESWVSNWGQAVKNTNIYISNQETKRGTNALRIDCDLGASPKNQGAVFNLDDMKIDNLKDKKVYVWAYFPSVLADRLVFRLAFKAGENWFDCISEWTNGRIGSDYPTDQWVKITFDTKAENTYTVYSNGVTIADSKFDWTDIKGYGFFIDRDNFYGFSGAYSFYIDAWGCDTK